MIARVKISTSRLHTVGEVINCLIALLSALMIAIKFSGIISAPKLPPSIDVANARKTVSGHPRAMSQNNRTSNPPIGIRCPSTKAILTCYLVHAQGSSTGLLLQAVVSDLTKYRSSESKLPVSSKSDWSGLFLGVGSNRPAVCRFCASMMEIISRKGSPYNSVRWGWFWSGGKELDANFAGHWIGEKASLVGFRDAILSQRHSRDSMLTDHSS
jgi:hypothetical protein